VKRGVMREGEGGEGAGMVKGQLEKRVRAGGW